MSKRTALVLLGAVAAALVALQLLPVDRSNPPASETVSAPPAVMSILRRACFDCHSHETVWPSYSAVAPISFLVAHDVAEGREHLNFSAWDRYDEQDRAKLRRKAWKEAARGDMPLPIYLPLHSEARLSPADVEQLRLWAEAAPSGGAAGASAAGAEHDSGEQREHDRHD
ncbi:MAG: heme-binding domain-containing protein [Holophagales bacterium]|nr:MAG: heme-binding domain-containing protein [Holophagales bacterium]